MTIPRSRDPEILFALITRDHRIFRGVSHKYAINSLTHIDAKPHSIFHIADRSITRSRHHSTLFRKNTHVNNERASAIKIIRICFTLLSSSAHIESVEVERKSIKYRMCKIFMMRLPPAVSASGSTLTVMASNLSLQPNRKCSYHSVRNRFKQLIAASGKAEYHISNKLKACRATKDFIKFAKQRGAIVTSSAGGSSHSKVSHNGICYVLVTGKKLDLQNSACKLTIEAFKAMGIAWDY